MKICPTCQKTYPDDFSRCPQDGAHLTARVTPDDMALAGQLSRRFRIIRRLGAGGMGTVFLAEQIEVGNRPVALKVLNRRFLEDPEFLQRFQVEAASTGRIHHANVVTVYESREGEDGTPYIAMEYLEGESLREALKRARKEGRVFPVKECAEILMQVARGLAAAHKLGILHRDIKPDNIFLTHGDEGELAVKVVDFGIAKLRESTFQTLPGRVLGTPAYMSYEQAFGVSSGELDARSDVYSLGVVVYEMLTGCLPFQSNTPEGFLRKHVMEQPPPFRTVAPNVDVPPAVERVVMKALAKNRDQRYASALDFAHELTSAARPLPPTDDLPELGPTVVIETPPTPEVVSRETTIDVSRVKHPQGGRSSPPSGGASPGAHVPLQTPPATPSRGNAEALGSEPESSEAAAEAGHPHVVSKSPRLPGVTTVPNQVKYAALGLVVLGVVTGVIWHFY